MSEEGLKETPIKLIHVGEPIEMDDELFEKQLVMLEMACTSEAKDIKQIVASVVMTYHTDLEDIKSFEAHNIDCKSRMFGIFYAGSEEHNYGKETDFIFTT